MKGTAKPGVVATIASCVLVAVAAFYLLTEHLQHTLGVLPYAIILLCPLMHVFMHRGHGHAGGGHDGGGHRHDANAVRTDAKPGEV